MEGEKAVKCRAKRGIEDDEEEQCGSERQRQ